jgi:hypothetical protein
VVEASDLEEFLHVKHKQKQLGHDERHKDGEDKLPKEACPAFTAMAVFGVAAKKPKNERCANELLPSVKSGL